MYSTQDILLNNRQRENILHITVFIWALSKISDDMLAIHNLKNKLDGIDDLPERNDNIPEFSPSWYRHSLKVDGSKAE